MLFQIVLFWYEMKALMVLIFIYTSYLFLICIKIQRILILTLICFTDDKFIYTI
jgi:hypothetical protein